MFKKLKQKIEEGGDVGIDKVSFTPKKLPGSAVRTLSRNEEDDTASQLVERLPATVEQEETRDEDQGVVINDAGNPEISNVDMVCVNCSSSRFYINTLLATYLYKLCACAHVAINRST